MKRRNPRLRATLEEVGRHYATHAHGEVSAPQTEALWFLIHQYVNNYSDDFDEKSVTEEKAPVWVYTGNSPKHTNGTDPTTDDESDQDDDGKVSFTDSDDLDW